MTLQTLYWYLGVGLCVFLLHTVVSDESDGWWWAVLWPLWVPLWISVMGLVLFFWIPLSIYRRSV